MLAECFSKLKGNTYISWFGFFFFLRMAVETSFSWRWLSICKLVGWEYLLLSYLFNLRTGDIAIK